ncbi:unnamed protein product [Closterium sp. Naga37s-1]|nr:unnamed protein product [Closterium sp. Naga37s-1]
MPGGGGGGGGGGGVCEQGQEPIKWDLEEMERHLAEPNFNGEPAKVRPPYPPRCAPPPAKVRPPARQGAPLRPPRCAHPPARQGAPTHPPAKVRPPTRPPRCAHPPARQGAPTHPPAKVPPPSAKVRPSRPPTCPVLPHAPIIPHRASRELGEDEVAIFYSWFDSCFYPLVRSHLEHRDKLLLPALTERIKGGAESGDVQGARVHGCMVASEARTAHCCKG